MRKLLESIGRLRKTEVKNLVDARLREFQEMGEEPNREIFKELCFCILTAHFNAERSIQIQREMGDEFLTLPQHKLSRRLRELGHRYPNVRAEYIVEARKYKDSIRDVIDKFHDDHQLREWLVRNVKGIGYKEGSHFLRNIGVTDLAIIDFHIVDLLTKHEMIDNPKTITKRRYLEIEELLRSTAAKANLTLAELDLYLWHMETGKILK